MKITFPPNMALLEKWCAFKGKLPSGSENEHYIIIIYKQAPVIKFFYVTSKVEKARDLLKYDIGALVELNPSDWEVLTKNSCIQCDYDHLREYHEDAFRQAYADGMFEYFGKVPENVKTKIIYAICASKAFTETEKTMYTV